MGGICGYLNTHKCASKDYMADVVLKMHGTVTFQDEYCTACGELAENDELVVFWSGELYNKDSLCRECRFDAHNEAEVVLFGYTKLGFEFLQKLSGKYVFVIYSKATRTLSFVRDKIGAKPIYYFKNDDCFIFSTELLSLLDSELVPKVVDKTALSQFLQLTYIPSPACIIEGVKKVNQTVVCSADADGNVSEKAYWCLKPDIKSGDFEARKSELKKLLEASVKYKMDIYPNHGAFLSGGFDSSIVVSLMSQISDNPIKTFTVGYSDKQFDESSLAGVVAQRNGTEHSVLNLDFKGADIDTVLDGLDEPFADSSLIATYAACKFAKQYVDVAFMGDAGDELFAGYNKYLISYYGGKYKKIPKFIRKCAIEPMTKLLPRKSRLYQKVSKVVLSADMPIFEQRKRLMCLGFKAEELSRLMLDGYVDELKFIKDDYELLKDADEQTRAQYVDLKTVLEGDMLPKVEIAGRLSGIKTCAPILDDTIIGFAYSLPTEYKINKTSRKIILKEAFRSILPDELFTAPKHGFAVPIGGWLEKDLKERLLHYADKAFLEKQGLFNYDYINTVINEHLSHKKNRYSELWAFLVFQSWYDKNI